MSEFIVQIMDTITVFRFILPLVAISIIFFAIKLTKPPREFLYLALSISWVAGFLNLLVDIIQQYYGFWHYTVGSLIFGFPIDLYISVSLVVGVAFPLVYWWLKSLHKKFVTLFVFVLPFYFLLQDYVAISVTGNAVITLDSPYWWIADFFSLSVILYGTLIAFNLFFLARTKN